MLYIPPFFSDADSSTRSSRIPLKFQGAELRPDSDPVPPQTTMRVYEEVSCYSKMNYAMTPYPHLRWVCAPSSLNLLVWVLTGSHKC